MISIICDVCRESCNDDHISISDIELVSNGVGVIGGENVDLCSVTCLKIWITDVLHENGFIPHHEMQIVQKK